MKTLTLIILIALPFISFSQTNLIGKSFTPSSIETNGIRHPLSKDSVPFILQFIDNQNLVYKEMKSNYYIMHHCTYRTKNNQLEINFINKKKPALVYNYSSPDKESLILKEDQRVIFLSRSME